jgi:hypothetical protein
MVTLRCFADEPDAPIFLSALDYVRRKAILEGGCRPEVEAIVTAIDQYAEAATGNREYFLNNLQRSVVSRSGRGGLATSYVA